MTKQITYVTLLDKTTVCQNIPDDRIVRGVWGTATMVGIKDECGMTHWLGRLTREVDIS